MTVRVKTAALAELVAIATALAVAMAAQTHKLDDPVPPGSTFRILDLEHKTVDLVFRVETASDVAARAASQGAASGPHSTMSSDVLYLPFNPDAVATLTIRVADAQGQPIAGKRVQVTSAVRGGPADVIIQPGAPTDAQGIATARVRPTIPPHTAWFAARVLEDNVEIGQVVEIEVREPGPPSLLSTAFAPYFGGFTVSPLALVVGQPAVITVPLTNRRSVPVEVRVRFFATVLNIGLGKWPQIGETEAFVLRSGESRDATITWTPTVESGHLCFQATIWGRELPARASADRGASIEFVSYAPTVPNALVQAAATPTSLGTQQNNWGPVTLPPCGPPRFVRDQDYSQELPVHDTPCVPSKAEKYYCEQQLREVLENISDAYAALALVYEEYRSGLLGATLEYIQYLVQLIAKLEAIVPQFQRCVNDPPDAVYQQLAVAASDTPAGHLEAMITSMERYQGAEAQGDREWMARQLTARRLYLKRHGEALRRAADVLQETADKLPQDDPSVLSKLQAAQDSLVERWRRGERFSEDQKKRFKEAGVSEARAAAAIDALVANKERVPAKCLRQLLLETATLYRKSADEADRVASAGASTGLKGRAGAPVSQTYLVGNPHDSEETVDLFIRRASVPPEWKLSIVDAETAAGGQPGKRVQEVEAGRHYRVRLPAQGQVTVASVVVPVGVVGENTTARWADEGKIGDELIGGLMHELSVPGAVPDLQLPAVTAASATGGPPVTPGSASTEGTGVTGTSRWQLPVALGVGALLIVAIAILLVVRLRRKKPGA